MAETSPLAPVYREPVFLFVCVGGGGGARAGGALNEREGSVTPLLWTKSPLASSDIVAEEDVPVHQMPNDL